MPAENKRHTIEYDSQPMDYQQRQQLDTIPARINYGGEMDNNYDEDMRRPAKQKFGHPHHPSQMQDMSKVESFATFGK